jgi:alkanesulfonate monooxygenase SsuD/methylene tetrahydromethanopterin reductase-like flavin-dependent oxidoreductase (luciferase family)
LRAIRAAASRSTLKVPIRLIRTTCSYSSNEPGLPSRSTSRSAPPRPAQCTTARSGSCAFGMGYRSNEYESFGVPMADRAERYEESVELIRRLWTDERISFDGKHFTVRDQRIGIAPVQRGGPPVWVGAGVHRTGARRAARLGDAWIVPPHATPERLGPILDLYRDERERLGRGPAQEVVVRRELVLDEDADRARVIGLDARGKTTAMYAQFEAPDGTASYRHLEGVDQLAHTADRSYLFTDPDTAVNSLRELEKLGICPGCRARELPFYSVHSIEGLDR